MRAPHEAGRFQPTPLQRLAQGEEAYRGMLARAGAAPTAINVPPIEEIAGKRIHSPTNPVSLFVRRAVLVGGLLFEAACAPQAEPAPAPSPNIQATVDAAVKGTSTAIAQRPEVTPVPSKSTAAPAKPPEKPIAKPVPTEAPKPLENGWRNVTSTRYPYRIAIPPSWSYKDWDWYMNGEPPNVPSQSHRRNTAGVRVDTEPVKEWVELGTLYNKKKGDIPKSATVKAAELRRVNGQDGFEFVYYVPISEPFNLDIGHILDSGGGPVTPNNREGIIVHDVYLPKDGVLWQLRFIATESRFNRDNAIFNEMINHLKLLR